MLNREQMIEIAGELKTILVKKRVSPYEAEIVAEHLLEDVREKNKAGKENYMMKGLFE